MIRTMRFGTELRRFFRTKMTSLAILVAICIPLLYGALYLWAFWNPYDRLDHLSVAIVDEDRAVTTSDGTVVHAGSDVEKAIVDKHTLDWHETTASEATSGLAANKYYAVVTIPEGFSASVASVSGSSPIAAPINVTYDDANGYTTRTLLASVMRELRSGVSATLGESMVEKTLLGLNDISSGLTTAHTGAVSLADGTSALATGARKAADGTTELAGKLGEAATGAAQIQDGATTLADGAAQTNAGAQQLSAGAGTLATNAGSLAAGAQSLSSGLNQASSGASALASASTQLATGATSVAQGNQALATALSSTADSSASTITSLAQLVAALPDSDPQKASLTTQLATLSATLSGLKTQSATLASGSAGVANGAASLAQQAPVLSKGIATSAQGAQQIAAGSAALSSGASQLAAKTGDLTAGTQKVSAGASQIADKTGELATGLSTAATKSAELADGSRQVADGAASADEGATKLRDGLKTALDKVPTFDDAASTASVMSDPVSLDSGWSNEASSMGEGYAPYFVGLALYVGALILWMLLRPISKRSLAAPVSALRLVLSGALPSWALGLAQVAVLFGVLIGALGLHPTHLVATLIFAVLVSIAFVSLQQMIAIWLGPAVGRLVVLVLLMLQLTSAGGTFPAATTPLFFRVLHVILPMTRVVDGFRESLTGDLSSVFATSVTYLVVMIALNVGMATWGAARLRTWTITRLHPDVTL